MTELASTTPAVEVEFSRAVDYINEGNYGRAFGRLILCLKALKDRPTARSYSNDSDDQQSVAVIKAFIFTLGEWSAQLGANNMYDELLAAYKIALQLMPLDVSLLLTFGLSLYKIGAYEAAILVLREAVNLNPNSVEAMAHLENIYSSVIERWHFTMLNDVDRNAAFQRAIGEAIDRGHHHSSVLDIGAGTGLLSMFAVRSGAKCVYACEMKITMCGVAKKCLAANDMLDKVKLLNEKSTELKIPEHIPKRVSLVITETFDSGLFGEGIVDTLIHAWDHLLVSPAKGGGVLPRTATIWACAIESDHVRRFSRMLPESLRLWNMQGTIVKASKEKWPYESERLSSISGGFRALSSPIKILVVDFNDVQKLRSLKNFEKEVTFASTADGTLDAIALWFELHLSDAESISNGPYSNTCWETAIHHNEFSEQVDIRRGDSIKLKLKYTRAYLSVSILSDGRLLDGKCDDNCVYVQRNKITQFNDMVVQCALKKSLCSAIRQLTTSPDEIRLIVVSKMPLLSAYACSLDCVRTVGLENEKEMTLVKKMLSSSGNANLSAKLVVANLIPIDVDAEAIVWNILMANPVHRSGLLDPKLIQHLLVMPTLCMQPFRAVIPNRLRCVAVLIKSDVLIQMHRVLNEDKTLGLKISEEINAYSVTLHEALDFATLPHENLSDTTTVLDLELANISNESFYKDIKVEIKKSGTISAIAFWFELAMIDDIVLSTLNKTGGGYWHQAAFVLPRERPTTIGQTLILRTALENGHLKLLLIPTI